MSFYPYINKNANDSFKEETLLEKSLWLGLTDFTPLNSYPALPCPFCRSKQLKPNLDSILYRSLSKNAVQEYISRLPQKGYGDFNGGGFDILLALTDAYFKIKDLVEYGFQQFTCFFDCSMCKESVSALGVAKVPVDGSPEKISIKAEFFNPPIHLFEIDTTTPSSVANELLSTFSYFYCDINSSGNKLRRALERFCTELGYSEKNLHRNIEAFTKDTPLEGSWLQSLKLVGNEATHADGVTAEDLLDALSVFEVVLDIFRRRKIDPEMSETVKRLNKQFQKANLAKETVSND